MKLLIITINYNNTAGLKKTLDSVAAQTFRDFEHIIVDGGSTDGSVDLIRKYADDEAISLQGYKANKASETSPNDLITSCPDNLPTRVKWISEPDKGIYNAMNKGIEIALCKRIICEDHTSLLNSLMDSLPHHLPPRYLLFLNSGDSLVDENVVGNLMQLDVIEDIVYGHQLNEVNGELVEEVCIDPAYITFDTMRNAHIPHQSSLIRLDTLVALGGYDEDNKIVSDWAYVMKCLFMHNGTIRRIPNVIAIYDMSGISSIADKAPQWTERHKVLLKYFPRIMPDYERWDRLNKNMYMRLIVWLRKFRKKLP